MAVGTVICSSRAHSNSTVVSTASTPAAAARATRGLVPSAMSWSPMLFWVVALLSMLRARNTAESAMILTLRRTRSDSGSDNSPSACRTPRAARVSAGASNGWAAIPVAIVGSYGSVRMTASLLEKWRKNVISVTPAAAATCATVVRSKPCCSNSSNAHAMSRSCVLSCLDATIPLMLVSNIRIISSDLSKTGKSLDVRLSVGSESCGGLRMRSWAATRSPSGQQCREPWRNADT